MKPRDVGNIKGPLEDMTPTCEPGSRRPGCTAPEPGGRCPDKGTCMWAPRGLFQQSPGAYANWPEQTVEEAVVEYLRRHFKAPPKPSMTRAQFLEKIRARLVVSASTQASISAVPLADAVERIQREHRTLDTQARLRRWLEEGK